jgi:hypothetical protein
MRLLLLALASLGFAAVCHAQEPRGFGWKLNDKSAPPNPAQASRNGFGVLMLVTPDYEGFWKAWEGSTPPQVTTTEEVTRDQPVHAVLLFSGCRAAASGNCNVTAELAVTGPKGKPYGETMKGRVWSGPPAPAYALQASEGSLGFILEPEDPLGTYILKAKVTDHVAGTTLPVQHAVTAVPKK